MKNKKVVWIIIGIVSVALIALAITYAYWQITKTQQGVNEISSACLDISLVDAESGNTGVTLQDQYPLSDTEGATLKPYKFTVTNNCDTAVDYQLALESTGSSTDALKASSLKVMLDSTTSLLNANETVTPTIDGAYASHKLGMGTLAKSGDAGSSVTHELRLWIDESAPVSENNKIYTGKITVIVGQGISAIPFESNTLAYSIITSAGGMNNITEIEDFTNASTGLYKSADDDGISYYYRGDVKNNYVQFANMYWRIIRINGDETIRLIYAGTELVENGTSMNDITNWSGSDYGASINFSDSPIYSILESWYNDNLNDVSSNISESATFCYEREISERTCVSEDGSQVECNSNDAIYYSDSYMAYDRYSNNAPSLKCVYSGDNSATIEVESGVRDYRLSVEKNNITKPIGLITMDEAMMLGLGTASATYLPYTEREWTMTPSIYYNHPSYNENSHFDIEDASGIYSTNGSQYYLFPVINLRSEVDFTYKDSSTAGSMSDPYVITTN